MAKAPSPARTQLRSVAARRNHSLCGSSWVWFLQVIAIALLCLAYATVWVVLDVNRNIEADAITSADRVVREVQELGWRELT